MSQLFQIARRWWGEVPVYVYALTCAAVCFALRAHYDISFDPSNTATSFQVIYTCGLGWFFFDICWRLFRDRPHRPLDWARNRYFSRAALTRLAGSIPTIAMCAILIPVFSALKSMIPLFTEFTWDATFIAWDRALFFGMDPWLLLQPVFGYPAITASISILYNLWIGFLYLGVLVMALSGAVSDDLRRRFFLTYAMAWSLVGGLLATIFASVGPVFAAPILGIETFTAQVEYLRWANEQFPVMSVPVQDMLLEGYQTADGSLGRGISAMPSMHIAICVLFWLAAREISPSAGRFYFWYMVVIWIGSVHLGYHYALDGLLSLVAIWAIWKLVPYVFRAWDALPLPGRQAALRTNTVPAE